MGGVGFGSAARQREATVREFGRAPGDVEGGTT